MRTRLQTLGAPARLAAFAAGLAVVGGAAALAGAATGSERVAEPAQRGDAMGMDAVGAADHSTAQSRASGLSSVAGGYRFVSTQTTLPLGRSTTFAFRIIDREGRPVRNVDLDGGVRVHLIVVRRDFAGYLHVHPVLGADGSWRVPLTLAAPGAYRAFADFEIDGMKTVLGRDLFVPGSFSPAPLPAPASATAVDGFRVDLAHAPLHAGVATKLHFAISRNGRPVPSFDAYVGQRGHLVALRDGDLSYSHVHPEPDAAVGEIVFHASLPSAGRYRLFLQFKVRGVVHTAPFTIEVAR
jgi:hypothetical protein